MTRPTEIQLQHLVNFRSGQDYKHVADEAGTVPVYGSGGIFATASDYLYDGESVLFGRKGTIDRPLHVSGRFWTIDTMFYTELGDAVDGRWLYYWATTIPFNLYSTDTALPSMTSSVLGRLSVPYVDLPTQRAIADYLDRETREIDAMVGTLEELEGTLGERRSALIRSEVADLASVHGRVSLQAIARISSGDTIAAEFIADSGEYPVYGGNGLRGYTDSCNHHHDRVLIGRQGALCGNVHIARSPFWASEHALVLYPYLQVDLRWLAYATRDLELGRLSTAAAQPGITASGIGRETLPLISLNEQRRIADHLDHVTGKIDDMLAKVAELKSLLTERRAALITDVVMGRKDIA